jgi:hypothetical protein
MREQLDGNDMGPILLAVEAGECPEWKDICQPQSHVLARMGSEEFPDNKRWYAGVPLGVSHFHIWW